VSAPAEFATRSTVSVVVERVQRVEERLCRLLAGGWRNAGDDLGELGVESAALTEFGLPEVGARLRAVATAASPTEGLRAISLALTACRLVRVRLAPDEAPAGEWAPIAQGPRKAATSRLLPLARVASAEGEVWSCLWLQGGFGVKWVLIEPPRAPSGAEVGELVSWLVRPLAGRLRWRQRLPLSAGGDVEVCALDDAVWAKPYAANDHPLAVLFNGLKTGKLDENAWLGHGSLKAIPFDPDQLDAYVWPDPAVPAALAASRGRLAGPWALATTVQGVVPLALVACDPPRVVHLVPGVPIDLVMNDL
jgi:hypothetical protein